MDNYKPKIYMRNPSDEELRRARIAPDITGHNTNDIPPDVARPVLPADIYAAAGIDPEIPEGISRVEALHRLRAYEQARQALGSLGVDTTTEVVQ